jgi:hypothetical protein
MHDSAPRAALLERLLLILARLHTESEGYFDHPEQEQLWYNRGYADGMLQALRDLGYAAAIQGRIRRRYTNAARRCRGAELGARLSAWPANGRSGNP